MRMLGAGEADGCAELVMDHRFDQNQWLDSEAIQHLET
jgi:hypothetical protein